MTKREAILERLKDQELPEDAFIHELHNSELRIAAHPRYMERSGSRHTLWSTILRILRPHGIGQIASTMIFVSNRGLQKPLRLHQTMMIEAKE